MNPLYFRPATRDDSRRLWDWVNDPSVRAMSFNSAPIPFHSHCQWLEAKLSDPAVVILMAEISQEAPCGQIRLEQDGSEVLVHISVAPDHRGNGIGRAILKHAVRVAFENSATTQIVGWVKPENIASLKMFAQCGFREDARSSEKVRMVRARTPNDSP